MDHRARTGGTSRIGAVDLFLCLLLGCNTHTGMPDGDRTGDLAAADGGTRTDLSLADAGPGDGGADASGMDASGGDGGMCLANGQPCLHNEDCCSHNCILRLTPGVCCVQGGCP